MNPAENGQPSAINFPWNPCPCSEGCFFSLRNPSRIARQSRTKPLGFHSAKLNSPHKAQNQNIMCNSNNYIQISGRLTSDVTPNEKKTFARFSIAHNMGKNTDAMFFNCVIFKKEFDDNQQSIPWDKLEKGNEFFVTGKLAPNNWTDKEGHLHKSFDIVVNKIRDTDEK